MRAIDFPVGDLELTWIAPAAAVATGLLTACSGALNPARRAGRIAPIRAVLGSRGHPHTPAARSGRWSGSY